MIPIHKHKDIRKEKTITGIYQWLVKEKYWNKRNNYKRYNSITEIMFYCQ